jgi:hypothetical protein
VAVCFKLVVEGINGVHFGFGAGVTLIIYY